jgi:predicted NUDIX family NTP pyrophosphohydrolase
MSGSQFREVDARNGEVCFTSMNGHRPHGRHFRKVPTALGEIRQRGGKRVIAFAVEGDIDVQTIRSNTFEIEWPPKGGRTQSFPAIDRAEWLDLSAGAKRTTNGKSPSDREKDDRVAKGAVALRRHSKKAFWP